MNLNHIIFHFLFILHSIFILNFCYYLFPLSFPYIPSPLVPSTPLVLFIAFFLCISPALKPLLSFYPVLFHLTFSIPFLILTFTTIFISSFHIYSHYSYVYAYSCFYFIESPFYSNHYSYYICLVLPSSLFLFNHTIISISFSLIHFPPSPLPFPRPEFIYNLCYPYIPFYVYSHSHSIIIPVLV